MTASYAAEITARAISDSVRRSSRILNNTRLPLASGAAVDSTAIGIAMADLESLALDLAALLVVDTQSDQTITVFLPNLRLCKDLVLLVKKQINLYINTDMGSIRRCNLEGLIEYQPCSGCKKIIEIFPAKTFYLRGTLIGDFVVKTRGDAEFERVFDMSCWNPTRQRHYVNVEFANSSETNVDVLATQIDNMDLSD